MNNVLFKNCIIEKVEVKDFNEYWIYINANDNKEHIVKIQSHNLLEELILLKNNEKTRLYLSCRMADIDIFKVENGYCIAWSPIEIIYQDFTISNSEYDKLIMLINADN